MGRASFSARDIWGSALSEDDGLYEWDEEKRLRTIEKHGIDFLDLGRFFASPPGSGGAK